MPRSNSSCLSKHATVLVQEIFELRSAILIEAEGLSQSYACRRVRDLWVQTVREGREGRRKEEKEDGRKRRKVMIGRSRDGVARDEGSLTRI